MVRRLVISGACAMLLAACSAGTSPNAATGSSTTATARPTLNASPDSAGLDAALLEAATANDVAAATRLIKRGADVNHVNDRTESAYLIATSEVGDDPALLEATIAGGADIQAKDSFNGTGLIRAAERGYPAIIERLLRAGVEVNHVNNLGWTALHEAIILGDGSAPYVRVVQLLVDGGANVRLPSASDGISPIQHAERRGFTEIRDILRRAEANMTADSRLLDAAQSGSVVAVTAALDAGADIEARDDRRRTALLRAATEDQVDVARLLVSRGADVNAVDDQQDTPFLVTGVTGSVAMLETLLPGKPDTRLVNRYGGVSVIPASERGHVDYVRAVLDQTDIDVNHVNNLGWTALLEAVILGDGGQAHREVVRVLLDHGADPRIADKDGVTALQHARDRGFTEIAALLDG